MKVRDSLLNESASPAVMYGMQALMYPNRWLYAYPATDANDTLQVYHGDSIMLSDALSKSCPRYFRID
jgi:hypothetical protein